MLSPYLIPYPTMAAAWGYSQITISKERAAWLISRVLTTLQMSYPELVKGSCLKTY